MNYLNYSADIFSNVFSNFQKYNLTYLVEDSDWVIKRVGENLVNNLKKIKPNFKIRIGLSPFFLRRQIVHFGSESIFFGKDRCYLPNASNKTVLSWFHTVGDDARLNQLKLIQEKIDKIHVSCFSMKEKMIKSGINANKICVIPLGVDLSIFKPLSYQDKMKLKKDLGLPTDMPIIGSFQKDGVGWGAGDEPKMIKGPDIFVKTVFCCQKFHPFVLLSGPARGYIRNELKENGIFYKHVFAKNQEEMAKLYQAIDLYIIPSREEGGPLSLLEAMASGVPLVSTRVGMAQDLIKDETNGMLAAVESVTELSRKCLEILESQKLQEKLIKNGIKKAKSYDWKRIVQLYYEKMYRRFCF